MTEFYQPASGQTYTEANLQSQTGLPPTAPPNVLASNGIYIIVPSTDPYDPGLYNSTPTYTIVGDYANQGWTGTPLPLPTAKENASAELTTTANAQLETILCDCSYNNDVVTAVASQDLASRPARFQAVLDEMTTVTDTLNSNLDAVDAATSVDEIDSIIKQPSGTFVSGRGGAGPLDMQPSYFSVLTDLPPGIGEPDLEIYIPGTDTVIPYNASLPAPYKFDSMGNCYTGTDYRTTFRVAATGQVLGTVIPALGPAVPIAWTYNPTIPAASGGGGGSSSAF